MSTGGYLRDANDRYLQNARYLRLKNLTVGYTIPAKVTKKAGIDQVRVYFSGENLHYWSPMKKHTKYVDPEAAIQRGDKTPGRIHSCLASTLHSNPVKAV